MIFVLPHFPKPLLSAGSKGNFWLYGKDFVHGVLARAKIELPPFPLGREGWGGMGNLLPSRLELVDGDSSGRNS